MSLIERHATSQPEPKPQPADDGATEYLAELLTLEPGKTEDDTWRNTKIARREAYLDKLLSDE